MKKLIYLLTGILLAAFILPSCSNSLSITKRRYNKGFYVHQIKNKHNAPAATASGKSHNSALAAGEDKEAFRATEYVTQKAEKTRESKVVTASALRKSAKTFKAEHGAAPVELAIRNPVKAVKAASALTKEAAVQNEALSLLWILIVVILIVYILGLLMDGFGMGELIHILGVVILVLLILWLLRLL